MSSTFVFDPSKGLNTLIAEYPTLRLNDRLLTMRKLVIRDTVWLLQLAGRLMTVGMKLSDFRMDDFVSQDQTPNLLLMEMTELYTFLSPVFALPEIWDMIEPWFASLINVGVEELREFPMGTEILLVYSLFQHPDFKAFLALRGLVTDLPPLKQMMVQAREKSQNLTGMSNGKEP